MTSGAQHASGRKVAIVGNMNNSGFAMLRYFRDLGADAHLLPYATDGRGNLTHFSPSADTWQLDRWADFIRPLNVANNTAALIGTQGTLWSKRARASLNAQLSEYDYFVGSGMAPALFQTLGQQLDIYFPYGTGIEFYGDIEFKQRMRSSLLRRFSHALIRQLQGRGIRSTRHCLNMEMSLTKASFDRLGKPFERLAIPAVYNAEPLPQNLPDGLSNTVARMRASDLSMFCCARLLWARDNRFNERTWQSFTKNSDWMFHGLARFVQQHPGIRPLLAVVEYGPDVDVSKRLVHELGLQEHVLWLPMLPRREIMLLLAEADIGIGEFYRDPGVIWGGSGWEILAAGRPLVQSFNFSSEGFAVEFGHSPPPIQDVTSADDLARHLATLYADPSGRRRIGAQSLAWFNEFNGVGLAHRWLSLLAPGISQGSR